MCLNMHSEVPVGPSFRSGNMWDAYESADLFCVTTNATITTAGHLVMGAGIAKEVKERFPRLPLVLGQAIEAVPNPSRYGLLVSPRWPTAKLACFQVKNHWSRPADLDLIAFSVGCLMAWCAEHPEANVHLNFPGVGNGKLAVSQVKPILAVLPKSVTVWSKASTP